MARYSIVDRHQFRLLLRTLSRRSLLVMALGVFALFSTMGFVRDIMGLGAQPGWRVALDVGLSGTIALIYLAAIYRSVRVLLAWVVVHILLMVLLDRWLTAPPAEPLAALALAARMRLDAIGVLVAVMIGYTCAVTVAGADGAQYHRIHTEMRLAAEIHKSLVPRIAGRIEGFEYEGVSYPSGEVGGDLVDVVVHDGGWVAYLVDVSGHGVRSGVLMGMVKSAVRMAFRHPVPLARWISEVSEVLYPLKSASMYATVAAIQSGPAGLAFTVAGHLPILRVRASDGIVEEHTIPQVPIAMFEQRTFEDASLSCEPGDLLVLLTDGLTEVFDTQDRELGLDALKRLVAARRTDSLRSIADALIAAARAHGPQLDDQTVLLLRRSRDDG